GRRGPPPAAASARPRCAGARTARSGTRRAARERWRSRRSARRAPRGGCAGRLRGRRGSPRRGRTACTRCRAPVNRRAGRPARPARGAGGSASVGRSRAWWPRPDGPPLRWSAARSRSRPARRAAPRGRRRRCARVAGGQGGWGTGYRSVTFGCVMKWRWTMTTTDLVRAGRREWTALAALMLPTLIIAMDLAVLILAIPALGESLRPSGTQLLWITDVYGFLIAGSLVTMGTLGDRIGRRRLLLAGATAFGLASLLAAYAPTAEALIAARALQGI